LQADNGAEGFRVDENRWLVVGCGPIFEVNNDKLAPFIDARDSVELRVHALIRTLRQELLSIDKSVASQSTCQLNHLTQTLIKMTNDLI